MKTFDIVKNIIMAVIVTCVCITAIFSLVSLDGMVDYETDAEIFIVGGIIHMIQLILALVAVLVIASCANNIFVIYAENDGMEKHRTGLILLSALKHFLTLVIELLFISVFFIAGVVMLKPALVDEEHIKMSGNMDFFGWMFIVISVGIAVFAVINFIKAVKRAKISYTFDNIDMNGEYAEVLPPQENNDNE